ncbi:NusA antitermination factor [Entomoplasma freundtii]|uniref:Transcription termination/antitermination protein NusA n=1 Tax=Entomoplasma freundtii TaxID=74700 RepID=A0A2K8NUP0_9MOLU|nr:transcription termination factor NusA [Entomoplasma freundtii]ATZ16481.1 transcription elongation factor NusA [Entomoplasma freundtii]TDY56010.1 NusA antitermination factor [Entomoplasma freundtii]
MINSATLLEAMEDITADKGISKAIVIEGLKEGFQKAYEKFFDTEARLIVEINEVNGDFRTFQELTIVEEVEDDWLEVTLEDAKKIAGPHVQIGDVIQKEVLLEEDFSRLAVYQVRQILQQKIKGAERAQIYEKFIDREHEILRAKITGMNEQGTSYLIDIEGTQVSLWNKKVIPGEKFTIDQYINVYVEEVAKESRFSQIMVSRTAPHFLARLLEQQVPELKEGLVEIRGVAREPGQRAKVAVMSNDPNVDPVGAIIGPRGMRINLVSQELKDEKIDVIAFDENLEQFIMNAMAPVRVISITLDPETGECDVVVPNQQLSLAIGKRGMSARLVANLVQKHINIMSYDQALLNGTEIFWNGNINEEELNSDSFLQNTRHRRRESTHLPYEGHPTYRNEEMDLEALRVLQAEIQASQTVDEPEEKPETGATFEETDTTDLELDEIQKNLAAFDDLENSFNEDSEAEEPTLDEEYDDFYD